MRFPVLMMMCALPVLGMSSPAVPAAEKPASESLRSFFTNVRTFTSRFSQTVLDEGLNPIQESSGVLSLQRPDRFRWDYDAPFKQQIVGDGAKIWIYDEELSQVSVRAMSGGLAGTPAVLLSGQGRIDDTFTVKNLGIQGKLNWVQLLPLKKDGGFEDIRLGFEGNRLKQLEMVDGFGQTTRVVLLDAKENVAIDASRFRFTPPKGVDVVGDQ